MILVLLHVVNRFPWAELLPAYVVSCFYLHAFVYGAVSSISCIAWSLEVEVQFYVLAPAFAWLYAIRGKRFRYFVMTGLIAATTVAQGLWVAPDSWVALTILKFLPFFLVGFLFADIYLMILPTLAKGRLFWDVLSVAGWLALIPLLHYQFFETFLLPAAFLLLFLALFQSAYFYRLMTLSWVTTTGGMCYSIYLLHFLMISALGRFTKYVLLTSNFPVNLAFQVVLVGIPVLVVSALYFVFVEKPCMRKDWPLRLIGLLRQGLTQRESIQGGISPEERSTGPCPKKG